MSKTIDERVVKLEFDNSNFEANVKTSLETTEKLKNSMKFESSAKGLDNVAKSIKSVNMKGLADDVDTVKIRFSALNTVADSVLRNITNQAVSAGERLVKALTIQGAIDGFKEYETKLNSIQTIMVNTASKGTTMSDVTEALDELNLYADKTIYNFAEMTRNIGTFTAAGVDLDTSVSAIQGIANLAAASGSSSTQASTAMYQLSQAIATGTVKLMDWNSVVNAGMGGEKFQDALKETAKEFGVDVDSIVKNAGSFRDSLSEGWLSADILNTTLKKFTTEGAKEYADSMLKSGKYTQAQADALIENAQSMEDAATKVKTFTQLIDTLKESVGSGWAQTWEIVFGNFDEAKELWSGVADYLSEVISESADARNELLQGWKDAGGRDTAIESIANAFEALLSILKPIKEAFSEVFPALTVETLVNITNSIKNFTENMKISEGTANAIKDVFSGLFSIIKIGAEVIGGLVYAFSPLLSILGSIISIVVRVLGVFGAFFTGLSAGIDSGEGIYSIFTGIHEALSRISIGLSDAINGVGNLGNAFSSLGEIAGNTLSTIAGFISDIFDSLTSNVSFGDIFSVLFGGGILTIIGKIISSIGTLKDAFNGFGDTITGGLAKLVGVDGLLDQLSESLGSMTANTNSSALLKIAVALGIFAIAMSKISELSVPDIAKSLTAIRILIAEMSAAFDSFSKTVSATKYKSVISTSIAMIAIAEAINILASAMEKLSGMSWNDIAKGLVSIGVSMLELSYALKKIDKIKINLRTSVAIIAIAKACEMLATAMKDFSKFTWDEIARGLTSMGGALTELVLVFKAMSKVGGFSSIASALSILIAVQALDEIGEALKNIGSLDWGQIARGLSGMGGALAEVSAASGILGKLTGVSGLVGAVSIVLTVQALDEIGEALKNIGSLDWGQIARGLSGMGGALAEVSVASGALGKLAGLSGIIGSISINIISRGLNDLATAFKSFASNSWDEVGRGLSAMGGALAEVSVVSGVLGKLAGLAGILGGATIWVAVQGLNDLATAFKSFASNSWDEVGRGLSAMGGALAEVSVVSGALGSLTNVFGLLGAASLWVGIQGLEQLATALQKFASLSWDEIKRGLSAMGGALGETALGGFLNTLSGIGALSISAMAEPLGQLADSVKKWEGVSIPEGLGKSLGSLGLAVMSFTFSGFGASSIATVAEPLGVMADSVKKWETVNVPDGIGDALSSLSSGVRSFTFSGFGASSIATVAEPLGVMADSVKKWETVNVSSDLGANLESLSTGVKSFTLAFVGANVMGSVVEPLESLREGISKWCDLTWPVDLSTNLTDLATAIEEFSTGFLAGWSMGTLVDPFNQLSDILGKLASIDITSVSHGLYLVSSAIEKFSGITINSDNITSLGNLFNSFSGDSASSMVANMNQVSSALTSISTALSSGPLSDTSSLGVAGDNIKSFTTKLYEAFSSFDSIDTSKINEIASGIQSIGSIDSAGITATATALQQLAGLDFSTFTSTIAEAGPALESAATQMMNSFTTGISNGMSEAASTVTSKVGEIVSALQTGIPQFSSAGSEMMANFSSGLSDNAGQPVQTVQGVLTTMQTTLNTAIARMRTLGGQLMQGLANGITDKASTAAQAAAQAVAQVRDAAAAAAEVNSPSRVFKRLGDYLMQGLALGIDKNSYKAEDSGTESAKAVISAFQNALGIHSPSTVAKDEVGRYIVEGIAEGITEDMTAEEAAEQKAQNIIDAFQDAIDEAELTDTIANLEYKFWQAINPDLGDEYNGAQKTYLETSMESQKKQLELAYAEYKTMLGNFGADNEKTLEAYQSYLQLATNYADTINSYNELIGGDGADAWLYLKNNLDYLIGKYKTNDLDTIWEKVKDKFNYSDDDDIDWQTVTHTAYLNATELISEVMNGVKTEVDDAAASLSSGVISTFGDVGTDVAKGIASGVTSETGTVETAAEDVAEAGAIAAEEVASSYKSAGEAAGEAYVEGLSSQQKEIQAIVEAWTAMGNELKTAGDYAEITTKLMSNSGSGSKSYSYTEEQQEAISKIMSEQGISSDSVAFSIYQASKETGEAASEGYADGVSSGSKKIKSAVTNKIVNTTTKSIKDGLSIASPSKVTMRLGRYTVEGFAKGISQSGSSVEDAAVTTVGIFQEMADQLDAIMDGMYDIQPTISPTVDLRSVQESANEIGLMLGAGNSTRISAVTGNRINSSLNATKVAQPIGSNGTAAGVAYNFTQNNYSPKALSRQEIYRQTKNQFATLKSR